MMLHLTYLYALIFIILAIAFIYILRLIHFINKHPDGNDRMKHIASLIRNGAKAFLKKEYSIIAIYIIIVFVLFYFLINLYTALAFVLGALFSMSAGYIGMITSTKANVKTAQAARKSLSSALKVSFSSGLVMGLVTSFLGIFGILILLILTRQLSYLFGFAFGASSIALFARVGGGIYTKGADLGADLVGKVEANIPEDDPRNPGVIADNVGDNVGDVAGMGADLFESFVGSIIAAMSLGYLAYNKIGLVFPLLLVAVGLLSSIIGSFFVKSRTSPTAALFKGLIIGNLFSLLFTLCLYAVLLYPITGSFYLYLSILLGNVLGIVIGLVTNHYTSKNSKYAKQIARASLEGPATNILSGISTGFKSSVVVMLIIAITIIVVYALGRIYGIALAGVSMLATLGISLAIDAYGPVADNAGGIAEMSKLKKRVRAVTDKLDALGNTTAAIGKGFAIGSAALTALALLVTFSNKVGLKTVNIISPLTLVGLFIGGMLPFYFSSLTIQGVNKTARQMINEIRKQFKIKAILKGKKDPNYEKCITIATSNALKQMIGPAIIAILSPIVVGFLLGPKALIGLLAGSITTGVLLAISLANSGGVWDNAKKFIESGKLGGKGSDAHKASVIGDTVGDPFKDTAGPSLNILIKLMNIISLVLAPIIIKYGGILTHLIL